MTHSINSGPVPDASAPFADGPGRNLPIHPPQLDLYLFATR
jgi:hypothetical protein